MPPPVPAAARVPKPPPTPPPGPAPLSTPPPGAAPPPYSTPAPGPGGIPHGSIPLPADEAPQPAPAVWRQAHPSARRWVERRQRSHGGARGRAPSPPRIALGLFIAALGAWLIISYLPDRRPVTAAEQARLERQAGVDSTAWRFSRPAYQVARGAAGLYLTVGFLVALRGLLFRRRVEVSCSRCGRPVVAERSGFTMRCEGGPHATGLNASAVALTAATGAITAMLLILIAVASTGG